jgi:hypothetical protein
MRRRPILKPEAVDAAEVIGIIGRQGQVVGKGGRGNRQVEVIQSVPGGTAFSRGYFPFPDRPDPAHRAVV